MLKKFEVKDFKNFKEKITIDFANIGGYQFSTDCIIDNFLGKVLIYGRNGTGKSNLGLAIMDIVNNFTSSLLRFNDSAYLNADSDDNCVDYIYTFIFDETDVIYKYRKFSTFELRDEELIVNGKRIFYCNYFEAEFKFDNLSYVSAESVVTERFLSSIKEIKSSDDIINKVTIPFLRWLISNSVLTSNSVLLKLNDFVKRMSILTVGGMVMYRTRKGYDNFFEILSDKNELTKFEDFLNLMGMECQLVSKKLPDKTELYFKHKRLIPFFENASSGTIALLNMYRRYFIGATPSLMYLDEFDAFYHFEMAENLLKYFKFRFPKSQVIFTSHNTNLISNRLLRPDCIFILSRTGKLTSLSNATQRELREGHNLQKMYISGEFERYE